MTLEKVSVPGLTVLGALEGIPQDFLSGLLGGNPLLFRCTIANNGYCVNASALADTGACGFLFMSLAFAKKVKRFLQPKEITGFQPSAVGGFDGRASQNIDVALVFNLRLQGRTFRQLPFLIVDMKRDIILGKKFLETYDILPDSKEHELLFPKEMPPDGWRNQDILLNNNALVQRGPNPKHEADRERRDQLWANLEKRSRDGRQRRDKVVSLLSGEDRTLVSSLTDEDYAAVMKRVEELRAAAEDVTPPRYVPPHRRNLSIQQPGNPSEAIVAREDEEIRKMERAINDKTCLPEAPRTPRQPRKESPWKHDARGDYILRRDGIGWYKEYKDFGMIQDKTLKKLMKEQPETLIGVTSLHEIDHLLADRYVRENELNAIDPMPFDSDELRRQALKIVPPEYHEFLDQFSKAESDKLAPHRSYDHDIELLPGKTPEEIGHSPLYRLGTEELEACREYIRDNLHKGFIEPSVAPWASPILMARKSDGGLRFCVDFRKLNSLTKKDRYPLPLIDETLARISKAKYFTKLDIRQAFHKVRLKPSVEDLTTFRTRYGSYKYKVMPFGLTNGPATFQRFINDALLDYLDDFCHAYIDDILIYSNTLEEHREHVLKVLGKLREMDIFADLKKCEFHVQQTKYLGFIVGTNGIAVDPEKISVVKNWKPPTTVKGVQSFLGFCNFYRRFVRDYGRIARPLTTLTKKDSPFDWTPECDAAFRKLKKTLLSAPVLAHFLPNRETRVETDASDGVLAGVLSQKGDDEDWHPVAFYSQTMAPAEMNYGAHDKELLAVIRALQTWRPELIGLQRELFTIITDHRALEFFSTKKVLNLRQAGWADLMAQYHFVITYRPGTQNAAADGLSRKTEELKTQKEKRDAARTMTLFRLCDQAQELAALDTDNLEGVNECGVFSLDSALDEEYEAELAAARARSEDFEELFELCPMEPGHSPDNSFASGFTLLDKILSANREHPEMQQFREKALSSDYVDWTALNGLVMYQGRLIVPETSDHLRTQLIHDVHSRITSGHPGKNKTRQLVRAQYWWPGLAGDVDRFVANCPCRSAKVPRDKTPGLLQPLPIPDRSWSHVVMDFKKMPRDKHGFDNIFSVIDRLSKQSFCTACTSSATAKDAARMYYEGPFRQHGLPDCATSDRGPQFVADFVNELAKILDIDWKLASSGHHETAGQVENLHQLIDQRLRPFVSHYHDDWSEALPAVDFVQLTSPHDSLAGLSPHEVLHGYKAPSHFDWNKRTIDWTTMPPREQLSRQEAQTWASKIQEFVTVAKTGLALRQKEMTKQANRSRREPDFGVGDFVLIIRRTDQTDRPSDKLDYPLTRNRFKILEQVGAATFRLEMPLNHRGTDIYHADRLRKHPNNPLPGQDYPRPGPDQIDDEDEWEVEKIVASRISRGKLQYQVDWRGWDPDSTWYPASNFKNATRQIREFHNANPEKAGPPLRLDRWEQAAEHDDSDEPHPDDDNPTTPQPVRILRRRLPRGKRS